MPETPQITIVGLGPGDAALLTVEAREVLASASQVWLRTKRHPTVASLPSGPDYQSFDALYDEGRSFEDVYDGIVRRVIHMSGDRNGVIYAVPGHPLFGEATVRELLARSELRAMNVRIVPGVSFLDSVASVLRIDPLADGLLLLDALALCIDHRLLVPERPTLIAQIYERHVASQVKLALLEHYSPDHAVAIVRNAGADHERVMTVALAELDHEDRFDHLASLYVPALALTADVRSWEGLRRIIARLRSPDGGCPWDLEQTHETLKRFLLEEAYEALDALDEGNPRRIAEELGDLLMQVVLHAQVAEDAGEFAVEDVLGSIAAKLVRRHPHVFGNREVADAKEVVRNWETLKKDERGDAPVLDAVPRAMPALAQAQALQSRAANRELASMRLREGEIPARLSRLHQDETTTQEEFGALLFDLVTIARARNIDAEEALRVEARRFREDVNAEEARRNSAST